MSLFGYSYRVKHNVTLTTETTDYQINIRLFRVVQTSYANNEYYVGLKCNYNYSDVRFTSSNGNTLLSFWMEQSNSTYADFVVKVNTINNGSFIYVYYGNPLVTTTTSNGDTTFLLFDEFNGNSINTNKWSLIGDDPTLVYQENNSLVLNSGSGVTYYLAGITSLNTFDYPIILECVFTIVETKDNTRLRLSGSIAYQSPLSIDVGIYSYGLNNCQIYWNGYTTIPIVNGTYYRSREYFIPSSIYKWEITNSESKVNIYSDNASTSKSSIGYQLAFDIRTYTRIKYAFVRKYNSNNETLIQSFGNEELVNTYTNVIPSTVSGTFPLNVTFGIYSTLDLNDLTLYFGDGKSFHQSSGTTHIDVLHTYNIPGTYIAELLYNGDYLSNTITVTSPVVVAAFTADVTNNFVTFTNTSSNASEFEWNFGDGRISFASQPIHEYWEPGTYNVTLLASNEYASHTYTYSGLTIANGNWCHPQFATFDYSFATDVAPVFVQFEGTTTPCKYTPNTSVAWNFGDGNNATSEDPNHVFNTHGYKTVTFTVYNEWGSYSTSNVVSVYPKVHVDFSPNYYVGVAGPVSFNALCRPSNVISGYAWSGAFTSTEEDPTITFASGTYSPTLTVTDVMGRSHTLTKANSIIISMNCLMFQDGFDIFENYSSFACKAFDEVATMNEVYAPSVCFNESYILSDGEFPTITGLTETGKPTSPNLTYDGKMITNSMNDTGKRIIYNGSMENIGGLTIFDAKSFMEKLKMKYKVNST